jgi:hypothetical protein
MDFRKVTPLQQQSGVSLRIYVSGVGATCFFGLALIFGGSRRTGAACAATFFRSRYARRRRRLALTLCC